MLHFYDMCGCVLEPGCLDLPKLERLVFSECSFQDADALPNVSALQRLTCFEFSQAKGPLVLDPWLTQLCGLQRFVLSQDLPFEHHGDMLNPPGTLRLPADMSSLSSTLLHLDVSGQIPTRVPLALTQLVALEHLNAKDNAFTELPAGITALSRLTKLMLGRFRDRKDPLQLHVKHPLDARALGDLSRFPALRELTFDFCEVVLCRSVLGAARHASLASLCFCLAHPAPECAPVVLQLSRELLRVGRGSVLKAVTQRPDVGGNPEYDWEWEYVHNRLRYEQGRAPFHRFMADLEGCRLEACGL